MGTTVVTGSAPVPSLSPVARFEWERRLRDAPLTVLAKAVCLLLGTYMDADGTSARPAVFRKPENYKRGSAPTLCDQLGRERSTVLAALREATDAGWLISIDRPGRPTERVAAVPFAVIDAAVQGSSPPDPSSAPGVQPAGPLEGSSPPDASDGSDGGVQPTGPQGSDQSDPTRSVPDQDQLTGTREEAPMLVDNDSPRDEVDGTYGRLDWHVSWCADAIAIAVRDGLCSQAEAPLLMQALADDPETTSPRRLASAGGVRRARALLRGLAGPAASKSRARSTWPPRCGAKNCNQNRRLEDEETRADLGKCPRCHPDLAMKATAA